MVQTAQPLQRVRQLSAGAHHPFHWTHRRKPAQLGTSTPLSRISKPESLPAELGLTGTTQMAFPEPPARGRHRASPFQGRRQRFLSRGQLGEDTRRRGAVRPGTETRREPAEGPTFRPLREITFNPADLVAPGQAGARECRFFSAPQTPSTEVGGRRASHRLAPWWRIRKGNHKLRATGRTTHLLQALAQGGVSQATQVEICSEVASAGLLQGRPREISQPLCPHLRAQGSDMSRKRLKPDTAVSDAKAEPEEAEAQCQVYK